MGKHILVTGAGGFIGSHLAERLEEMGHTVTWLSRTRTPLLDRARGTLAIADMCTDDLRPYVKEQQVIFHLAGIASVQQSLADPEQVLQNNIQSTLNLLQAVRDSGEKPHLIFLSSDRVYGAVHTDTVTETVVPMPIDTYALSKLAGEYCCRSIAQLTGFPWTIIRAGNVFGPGQRPGLLIPSHIQRLIIAHREGRTTVPIGSITNHRNFLYVTDLIDAFLAVLEQPAAKNEIFNIAAAHCSIAEVISMLEQIASDQLGVRITTIPDSALARPSRAELPPYRLDCHKAENLLKWKPRHSLQQALEETFSKSLA